MTRVLLLTLRYPPHHLGGYEVSSQDVADRLAERGHDVTVLCSALRLDGVADAATERDGPVRVRRELGAWVDHAGLDAPGRIERFRRERASQAALLRALDEVQPDVVSVWQLGGLSLGLVTTIVDRGIPLVYALSDDWLSYAPVLDAWSRIFRRLPAVVGRVVAGCTRVPTAVPDLGTTGPLLFISETTRQRAEIYADWSMPTTSIVYSGIDTRLFQPPREPKPWGGHLLYVGRYDPRKGIETLIRALALLPDATTLEVQGTGDPAEAARLEALVAELGLTDRVEFGSVRRAELPDRYRAADAVVFPSEWEEPFGLVPLEAMACGVPVAATGVGGSGEFLVDGGNCVRFDAGDPDALAAAVRRLADDPALRAALGRRGASSAAAFDSDLLTDAYEAWHAAEAAHDPSRRPSSRRFRLEGDHART